MHTVRGVAEDRLFGFQGTKKRALSKANGHSYPVAIRLAKRSLNPLTEIELFPNHTHIGLSTSVSIRCVA